MAKYDIYIESVEDPLFHFTGENLKSIKGTLGVDVIGDELSYDEIEATIFTQYDEAEIFAPLNYDGIFTSGGNILATSWVNTEPELETLTYGVPIWIYKDGTLIFKGYSKSVSRISRDDYQLAVISPIGLLTRLEHKGGVYANVTFSELAKEIIDGAFPYTVDESVADLLIFGWLPIATRRDNLHQLLFASGVAVTKDKNGDVVFTFVSNDDAPEIPDNRIYIGGAVDYQVPVTEIEVIEHGYVSLDSDVEETLFDNTDEGETAADHTTVTFSDAPIHDIRAEGLVVEEGGVNYAIISGKGTLYGKPYTHTTKSIIREITNSANEPNRKSVKNATLVSVVNSDNVVRRLMAYYSSSVKIKNSIVLQSEKAGGFYKFTNPFDEQTSAFLSRMDIVGSGIIKANCEMIAGYIPTGQGNAYQNIIKLTGSGTWDIPDEILDKEEPTVIVTLIGGGSGGQAGFDGANVEKIKRESYKDYGGLFTGLYTYTTEQGTYGSNGGSGGAGGAGGKVYTLKLNLTDSKSIEYSAGKGGHGGEENGALGEEGTDTIFGEYSSAEGSAMARGYTSILDSTQYAAPGGGGYNGGKGGTPLAKDHYAESGTDAAEFKAGVFGEDNGLYHDGDTTFVVDGKTYTYYTSGGGGGGAAYGADGANGGDARMYDADFTDGTSGLWVQIGQGANGADAIAGEDGAVYGNGGNGGHGGGGGGGNGDIIGTYSGHYYTSSPTLAKGGKGGRGGKGADGIIIIMY